MKYKYYFKKPRSEIVKDVLRCLMVAGLICIAATSPRFVPTLLKEFKKLRKYNKRKLSNTFWRLKREGCIIVEKRGKQLYFRLTEKGKKMAGWLQVDELKIKKPKKWDAKWRIVIFDISQLKKFFRELFRGKLKELGFYPLQKSVWICPFDCRDEIEVLREFFGLSQKEVRLIVAENIENDTWLRKFFKL